MNKYHHELLAEIKRLGDGDSHTAQGANYTGSTHIGYGLSLPVQRQIVKKWVSEHNDISLLEFVELLNSLIEGESMDEKTAVGKLLEYMPKLRRKIDPNLLESWLEELVGWAEIDSLCQPNFKDQEMLENWEVWERLLKKFARDQNISKRRASLVLLTGVVNKNPDQRLSNLAFENIDRLKLEKNILITKAISWLLRDLIKLHRQEVEEYIDQNKNSLPAIAIRETKVKLATGKKTMRVILQRNQS